MHLIVRCLVSICASVPPAPLYLIWTAFEIIFEIFFAVLHLASVKQFVQVT